MVSGCRRALVRTMCACNLRLCLLPEYLDTKKKIFPRFYFVSNVALLDILSNGNNPPRITPYLGDCYDSIGDLLFVEPTEEGMVRNTATRMISKDGEYCRLLQTVCHDRSRRAVVE